LLAVAAKGQSTCITKAGGYCALLNPCEDYQDTGLWDYDFRIQFDTVFDDNYIRVPLASFAANSETINGQCVIYVEMLDIENPDSRQIILGSMFFQSFYAQYSLAGFNAVNVTLMVNENALAMTYLGSEVLPEGDDPFNVTPLAMTAALENQGLPTFNLCMNGIATDAPYFYVDFSNSEIVAWDINCTHTQIGSYPAGACSTQPTYM